MVSSSHKSSSNGYFDCELRGPMKPALEHSILRFEACSLYVYEPLSGAELDLNSWWEASASPWAGLGQ